MKKVIRRKDPSSFNLFDKISYFMNFICKSFLYAVLSLMVIVFVMFGIYFVDLLTNVKTGNYRFPIFGSYIILTKSMIPTINVNDAVLVKRSELNDFSIGDIITFSSIDVSHSGMTITHRIVGKQEDSNGNLAFRTKGDNNSRDDSAYVPFNNVYGKVIFKMPKLGYVQRLVSKPIGLIVGIFIPIFIVLFVDGFKVMFSYVRVRNE